MSNPITTFFVSYRGLHVQQRLPGGMSVIIRRLSMQRLSRIIMPTKVATRAARSPLNIWAIVKLTRQQIIGNYLSSAGANPSRLAVDIPMPRVVVNVICTTPCRPAVIIR